MKNAIVFAISAHGFGHLGQSVPVIEALRQRYPDVPVVVLSSYTRERVAEFVPPDVHIHSAPEHVTVAMRDALTVDSETTRERFLCWHRDYAQHQQIFVDCLRKIQPRMVLSNVDFTWISAAQTLSLPTLVFCSLNWADILDGFYPGSDMEMRQVTTDIRKIYNSAGRFLRVSPGMGMPGLSNLSTVDVLARSGRRYDLRIRLRVGNNIRRVALFSLGGIAQRHDLSGWDIPTDTHLIVPDNLLVDHPRISPMSALGLSHIDILASVDVLVTKPGYGSFCEAWRNQTAVIYMRRNLWPEETALIDWIQRHVPAIEMSCEEFTSGALATVLARLAARPATFDHLQTGENAIVNHIGQWLG